jgi:hypothetical protein
MKALFFFIVLIFSFTQITWAQSRLAKTLHIESTIDLKEKWSKISSSPTKNVERIVAQLEKSKTGRKLINMALVRARQNGEPNASMLTIVSPGAGSLTDTTLVRRFSPHSPEDMEFESRSKIFINQNLSFIEAVLDLAHELTHFVFREAFNPYQNSFTLEQFISSTIEGRGGEVQAYLMECQVQQEIFPQIPKEQYRCHHVRHEVTGKLSKQKGIAEFYKVGPYLSKMGDELKRYGLNSEHFPLLSKDTAYFISSAYGLPYPLAAIKEYVYVMTKACENDYKRLTMLQNNVVDGPTSSGLEKGQTGGVARIPAAQFQRISKNLDQRCSAFF